MHRELLWAQVRQLGLSQRDMHSRSVRVLVEEAKKPWRRKDDAPRHIGVCLHLGKPSAHLASKSPLLYFGSVPVGNGVQRRVRTRACHRAAALDAASQRRMVPIEQLSRSVKTIDGIGSASRTSSAS